MFEYEQVFEAYVRLCEILGKKKPLKHRENGEKKNVEENEIVPKEKEGVTDTKKEKNMLNKWQENALKMITPSKESLEISCMDQKSFRNIVKMFEERAKSPHESKKIIRGQHSLVYLQNCGRL